MAHPGSSSSGEPPPAADEDPFVSVAFYNVGIQNSEVAGRKWADKCEMLKRDIEKIFDPNRGVQAAFILEFGNMYTNIDNSLRSAELQRSKRLRGGVPQPAARLWPFAHGEALFEVFSSGAEQPAGSMAAICCHRKADEAKRECDGTHLAPSAMSTFFVEYPCVPHVCVPLHCSCELLFALRSQNMAAGIDDSIAELTWPSWLGCLAGRLAGWLAGWLVS